MLSASVLTIDAERVSAEIEAAIRDIVLRQLKRRGVVLGLSGGIDSSVTAALCVRALGANRVVGLFMPEADSSGDSLRLGRVIADAWCIKTYLEDMTPILEAAGCYSRRDEAIRSVVPEYQQGFKCKLVQTNVVEQAGYPVFYVVVRAPDGAERRVRLTADACLGVVAASNFKQRARKMMEYYYADRFQLAVVGTPNLLEYDQGFFVKNGDGAADLKPIAHLYKTQIYQLADYLGIDDEIRQRPPTTDTYPLEQSQEEFYFSLSLRKTDLCVYGRNHGLPATAVASATGLSEEQVERVYALIDAKRSAARYLHAGPVVLPHMTREPGAC